jgi:hypothetical protein
MTTDIWHTFWMAVYFAVFAVTAGLLYLYYVRRQQSKPPLEFKFLRGPGESLRQRGAKFDEDLIIMLPFAALAPIVAALLTYGLLVWINPRMKIAVGLTIVAIVGIGSLVLSMRWFLRRQFRARNDRLGYLGERAVGEALNALGQDGFRIFHDIPADSGGYTFNVDHVAVGPHGVFAIETKTRRKGRARAGYEAHKIAYDGQQLIWPWGEDRFGLRNAEDRARWLTEWLNKMTGLGIIAKPVLVLPGWFVVPQGVGSVTVVNHKQVTSAILRALSGMLTGEQVELIARQLDARCRDVAD